MKKLPMVVLSASLLAFGVSGLSQAATFDFVGLAAGNEGSLSEDGVENVFTDGGLTLTLTANNIDGSGDPLPYLDDLAFGGLPGGLGVCQTDTTSCGDDDNITNLEIITLAFNEGVDITQMDLSNGDHEPTFNGNIGIVIDDTPTLANFQNPANQYMAVTPFVTQLTGQVFHIVANATFVGNNTVAADQLYLNLVNATPVPLPGAAILFGTGAAALGWWR